MHDDVYDETPQERRARLDDEAAEAAIQAWKDDRAMGYIDDHGNPIDPEPDDDYCGDPEVEAYEDAVDAQGPTDGPY